MFIVDNFPGKADWSGVLLERATFRTLEEARDDVRRRLGDLEPWRRCAQRDAWETRDREGNVVAHGVEAYHKTGDPDGGGVAISRSTEPVRTRPRLRAV